MGWLVLGLAVLLVALAVSVVTWERGRRVRLRARERQPSQDG
jgi:hypothetical protein